MDSLIIDDDAIEVEEDCLNHACLKPAREQGLVSLVALPNGRASDTFLRRLWSSSPPALSTHQSFRSALQTAAAVAHSPARPNVGALHSARVHSPGSPDNQDPRAGDPSSLAGSATS